MEYIERTIEPVLRAAVSEFPAVVLTGPRQSGKTTVLKHLFGQRYEYVSMEALDTRALAAEDPRSFLHLHKPPVILDEVQQTPELLPYLQELIDERRHLNGQYVLSGSQDLLLLQQVGESLAGRAAILKLLPLSLREWAGEPARPLPWQAPAVDRQIRASDRAQTTAVDRVQTPAAPDDGAPVAAAAAVASAAVNALSPAGPDALWQRLFQGQYPALAASSPPDWLRWQQSYIETYLERDVRTVRQVGDLMAFQSFLRLLAARSGQVLNMTGIANELGLSLNTVKAWISVLVTSYQIIVLPPYHANLGKRLVKRPKVYFTDTGTLCYLVGLREPLHAMQGPMAGAIMETAVVAEITKAYLHAGDEPRLTFWRTARGSEVDILVEDQLRLYPVEVKASATPRPEMARGIAELARSLAASTTDVLRPTVQPGYVVYAGERIVPLGHGVSALPLTSL
jgi:predicted AAA+ superfamily ATPase